MGAARAGGGDFSDGSRQSARLSGRMLGAEATEHD